MAGAITTIPLREQLRETEMRLEGLKERTAVRLRNANQQLTKLTDKVKENAQEMGEHAVQSAEVGGTALIVGILSGKSGGWEIGGVPAEMLASVGLHVGAYVLGVYEHKETKTGEPVTRLSRASEHLHNIGDGSLAAGLTVWGLGIGRKWAQDSAAAAQAAVQQTPPPAV